MRRVLLAAIMIGALAVMGFGYRPAAIVAQQPATTGGEPTIIDPRVDANATMHDALRFSQSAAPIAGPLQETKELAPNERQYLSSGVHLQDFVARYSFVAPAADGWMMGFTFWDDDQGNSHDVSILSNAGAVSWALGHTQASQWQAEQFGDVADPAGIGCTAGAECTLALVAFDGVAIMVGGNSQMLGQVDIGGTSIGDVTVKLGWSPDGGSGPSSVSVAVTDFSVWDLSQLSSSAPAVASLPMPGTAALPALPSIQGTSVPGMVFDRARTTAIGNSPVVAGFYGFMTQTAESYGFASIEATVADFYSLITVVNPVDAPAPFDFSIGFRSDDGSEPAFVFVVRSDGTWELKSAVGQTMTQGSAAGFQAGPGVANTIELLVQAGTGIVALNGVVQASFDVSSATSAGHIYLFNGYLNGDAVDGQRISYTDWWVFPIAV